MQDKQKQPQINIPYPLQTTEKSDQIMPMTHHNKNSLHSSSLFPDNKPEPPNSKLNRTNSDDLQTKSQQNYDHKTSSIRNKSRAMTSKQVKTQLNNLQHNYHENLITLKVEEIIFKIKTRIGTILKQMDIPLVELNKFTTLVRIDDILTFLAEKMKIALSSRQIEDNKTARVRYKQQQRMSECEVELQNLRKKHQQRQLSEKNNRQKLKECHQEVRDLYDRLNKRERELSAKMTELYQNKAFMQQSQKLVQIWKQKCCTYQRECAQLRSEHLNEIKKITKNNKNMEQQNRKLQQKIEQLNDLLDIAMEKSEKMGQLNIHLSEELERWRQRFDTQSRIEKTDPSTEKIIKRGQSIDSKETVNLEVNKVNELTILNQNSRLTIKVSQLDKQNKELSKQMVNYNVMKQKYSYLLSCMNNEKVQCVSELQLDSAKKKIPSPGSTVFQLQLSYKKKLEEVAKQWRQKLIEMVNAYEQENDNNKQQISSLLKSNQELQSKILQLANQKYHIQNQLIQRQRQIYELTKPFKPTRQQTLITDSRVVNSLELQQPLQICTKQKIPFNSQEKQVNK